MTQRYAIVPVVGEFTDASGRTEIEICAVYSHANGFFLSASESGKITREQIENMAREFYNHIQKKGLAHLLYRDEMVEIFIEAQRKAAEFIGLEVEEEKWPNHENTQQDEPA